MSSLDFVVAGYSYILSRSHVYSQKCGRINVGIYARINSSEGGYGPHTGRKYFGLKKLVDESDVEEKWCERMVFSIVTPLSGPDCDKRSSKVKSLVGR